MEGHGKAASMVRFFPFKTFFQNECSVFIKYGNKDVTTFVV